jgi:hypothetical protein
MGNKAIARSANLSPRRRTVPWKGRSPAPTQPSTSTSCRPAWRASPRVLRRPDLCRHEPYLPIWLRMRMGAVQRKREPFFLIAVQFKMPLCGLRNALADVLGDIGVLLQVPRFIHEDRKRQSSLEIPVRDKMLLGRLGVPVAAEPKVRFRLETGPSAEARRTALALILRRQCIPGRERVHVVSPVCDLPVFTLDD